MHLLESCATLPQSGPVRTSGLLTRQNKSQAWLKALQSSRCRWHQDMYMRSMSHPALILICQNQDLHPPLTPRWRHHRNHQPTTRLHHQKITDVLQLKTETRSCTRTPPQDIQHRTDILKIPKMTRVLSTSLSQDSLTALLKSTLSNFSHLNSLAHYNTIVTFVVF